MVHSITREGARECETRMEGGAVKIIGLVSQRYANSVIHKQHLDLAVLEPEIRIDVTRAETIDASLFEAIFDYLRRSVVYNKNVKIVTRRGSIIGRNIQNLIDTFHYELELV